MSKVKKIIGCFVIMMCALLIIPNNVDAAEMSSQFKSLLNAEGKLIVNAVKPSQNEYLDFLFEYLFLSDGEGNYIDTGYSWDNVSEDMSSVDFTINAGKDNEETHTVGIAYVYDEDIKKMVDGYSSKIPADLEYFSVRDMEVINYWVNGKGEVENLINYSSQLKEMFEYKNFAIDLRMGGDDKFNTYASGVANFSYNNTVYDMRDNTGVSAKHIIYVSEDTGTTKEELVSAVQKRIDDYIGTGKVKVSFGGESIYKLYVDEMDADIASYESDLTSKKAAFEIAKQNETSSCANGYSDECMQAQSTRGQLEMEIMTLESYFTQAKNYKEYFVENYNSEDGEYYYLRDAVNGYYFNAEVGEETYLFFVVKDSSKMVLPITKTSDVETDITISTSNTKIPLDTTISVEKITSGVEYEKIVNTLDLDDNLIFDLKLYSNSLDQYVTKLSDDTFEVRIPIPQDFKNKQLVVYYVDADAEPKEFEVKPENDYAVFLTNHFSIYTLGYKNESIKVTLDANGGKFGSDSTYTIDNWHYSNYDNLSKPTREGYEFKGYYTEKTGGTSLEHILNEAGIDRDMTFYAKWEKQEEVPKTLDNISNSFIIGFISLVGLVCSMLYLKRNRKFEN